MRELDDYIDFFINEKGEDIKINGLSKRAIVTTASDSITYYDDKFIRTNYEIHTGDLVEYKGNKWIIISEIIKTEKSFKARMRATNYDIKIVVNEALEEFNSIIEGISFGIEENKFFTFETGKIQVNVLADSISNNIAEGMRFIKMNEVWKIVGVDKSKLGLINLFCEKDIFINYDDKVNEIADKNKIAVWEILINEKSVEVNKNGQFTYTATVKKNGSGIDGIPVVWATSDSSVATVSSGVVTGIKLGSTVISVYMQDKPDIKASININIVENKPDVITYKMWSSSTDGSGKTYSDFTITTDYTKWYGVEKYINGVLAPTNDTYAFTVNPNGTPASSFTFTVLSSEKVSIKAIECNSIYLNAKSNETGQSISQEISLVGGW